MSSPYSARVPTQILKPLYGAGLCEAVTWMPPATPNRSSAQYSVGVGTMPTSTTSTPDSVRARTSASRNA